MSEAERYDVIVVGTGVAASCAALEALEAGASVLMLDGAAKPGGSSRLSSGMIMAAKTRFQAERGVEDDPLALYDYYMAINRYGVQPSVARRLAYESGPTIHWLADRGVEIIDVFFSGDEPVARGHVTRGGDAIIEALHGRLQNFPKLDIAMNSYVQRLLHREGTVYGVATADYEVEAGAVVLATGGMGANLDMLAQWHPRALGDAQGRLKYVGVETSRGDSIRLGAPVGAQVTGMSRGSRSPTGPLGGSYQPGFSLIVNTLGRRYFDESSPYGLSEVLLAAQPGAMAFVIVDEATKNAMQTEADVRRYLKVLVPGSEVAHRAWTSAGMDELLAERAIKRANTLEELARLITVPPANLLGTVERYNQHVVAGEDADYLKKGEWLRPVSTPPFYASPITLYVFGLTGAGVRIDHNASVLHETSRSIPGLFAAGECTGGVLGDIYVGSGNSLANCTVFGRVAGRNAAAHALQTATGATMR
jgi:succinate dehydrogenase/fumarate reductase flavoprotein subunit